MPGVELLLNNEPTQKVERFIYLDTTLSETWDHSVEIKCRIDKAQITFIAMRILLTNGDLTAWI